MALHAEPYRAPDDVAEHLARNAVESLPRGALAAKLIAARQADRPLRVKLGIDPTRPTSTSGHAVVLGKLREFQDLGHRVVLIIGDYTARVGDPSGRSTTRPILSDEQIEANARTYQEQAFAILDPDPERLEVRRNSEWLDMSMLELLRLARTTTVAAAARARRLQQAHRRVPSRSRCSRCSTRCCRATTRWWSRADVELGGTDQTFNLFLAREIQRAYDQPEQASPDDAPARRAPTARQKMSKSLGNQIGVTDPPEEIYGKTMSIPDETMGDYYRLLLGREPPGPDKAARDAKRELAFALVTRSWSETEAAAAERHFDQVIVARGLPDAGARGDVRVRGRERASSRPDRRRVRHVALGGATPHRPGRGHPRRADARGR